MQITDLSWAKPFRPGFRPACLRMILHKLNFGSWKITSEQNSIASESKHFFICFPQVWSQDVYISRCQWRFFRWPDGETIHPLFRVCYILILLCQGFVSLSPVGGFKSFYINIDGFCSMHGFFGVMFWRGCIFNLSRKACSPMSPNSGTLVPVGLGGFCFHFSPPSCLTFFSGHPLAHSLWSSFRTHLG